MNDNMTTAVTVYVPKEQRRRNRLEHFLKNVDKLLRRYFVRNKRILLLLFVLASILFSLCIAAGKLSYKNSFVLSVYFSNEHSVIFLCLTVFSCLFSVVPIIGRVIVSLYSVGIISITSTFLSVLCFTEGYSFSKILLFNLIASAVIIFGIIASAILFELSSVRYYNLSKIDFIKIYYARISAVLLISFANYFLLYLLF